MSQEDRYKRDPNGQRFEMSGLNTVLPLDALGDKYAYLANVRAYLKGRIVGRSTQDVALLTLPDRVHSLRRLNDSTPLGPASGYSYIAGAGTSLLCNAAVVASGLSGNALALVPFRPNSSPQPWMYVADSNAMYKVRSDGLTYKMGIREPQNAPTVGSTTSTTSGNVTVLGTARPWSNVSGLNPTFNYGDTGNGSGPVVISTPVPGATLALTLTGTATVNGAVHAPGDAGPSGTSNPGHFATAPVATVLAAWTDANGNVIAGTGAGVVSVGAGATLTVPATASQLQVGVDGTANGFSANSGSFSLAYTLVTSAVAKVVSILGSVTAYYWGDSPHTGGVATYLWRNAGDTAGSGPSRDISTASGFTTNNSLIFDSTPSSPATPMTWSVLDQTGAVTGSQVVFEPALESQGYQDFNMCVVANLFVPAAMSYTFTITSKDNVLWGIGNNATWPNQGNITGAAGQTMTVVSKCPLLPSPAINSTGAATSITVTVTFPGPGVYPIEMDYDYWYHSGRTLVVQCNGATIPPLTQAAKEGVAYRYRYRSSKTGAKSNPSPPSPAQTVPAISNTITPGEYSTDPQADKVDYFRMDKNLDDFTYVGTGPNTNPPTAFSDQADDTEVASNPQLEYDNYEPFPSIDLPRGGVVNVIGGVVQWVGGDQFNLRWLGGTIVNIGGVAYTLLNRPSSATTMAAVDVPDGSALVYEIAEPILAGQPLASMWGDTDNTAYVFACGDKLRPGTLYWCKGNDLDSAPDTNQQDVTSPSEPLVNGTMTGGIGMVFSAENGWMIYPNFSSALATATGTTGSAFNVIRSSVTRGLFIRPCICNNGSGSFFYRSKDGIEMSSGGGQQQSLTDVDLYNLFPHEGSVPVPITRAGYTTYPPDDTQPERQRLSFAAGYLYYDYQDSSGTPRTLVLDVAGGGWVVDTYQYPAILHVKQEGANGVLTCNADGSVRALTGSGAEQVNCVVLTPAMNSGDARAAKTFGDIFLRATVMGSPVQVAAYYNQFALPITGYAPTSLQAYNRQARYILDFANSNGLEIVDVELALSWPAGTATSLELWQPTWTELPEFTQNRPTDWTDTGNAGAMYVQGLILEADTLNQWKAIGVESDDGVLHVPDQSPVMFSGQSKQALTFTPPFTAHMIRLVSTDNVPWIYFGAAWVTKPYPESTIEWQTEMTSFGIEGWMHAREVNIEHISTADLVLTLIFDPGGAPAQIAVTIPNSGGLQAKTKVTLPANKFKLASRRLSSSAPFRVFEEGVECKVGQWGRTAGYRNVRQIGGGSADGAEV